MIYLINKDSLHITFQSKKGKKSCKLNLYIMEVDFIEGLYNKNTT